MCNSKVYTLKKLAEAYPKDKGYILDIKYDADNKEDNCRYFMVKGVNRDMDGLKIDAVEVEVLA